MVWKIARRAVVSPHKFGPWPARRSGSEKRFALGRNAPWRGSPRAQGLDLEDRLARRVRLVRVELRKVATDHELHHARVLDLVVPEIARVLAIAQHRHAIGECAHFAEPV